MPAEKAALLLKCEAVQDGALRIIATSTTRVLAAYRYSDAHPSVNLRRQQSNGVCEIDVTLQVSWNLRLGSDDAISVTIDWQPSASGPTPVALFSHPAPFTLETLRPGGPTRITWSVEDEGVQKVEQVLDVGCAYQVVFVDPGQVEEVEDGILEGDGEGDAQRHR